MIRIRVEDFPFPLNSIAVCEVVLPTEEFLLAAPEDLALRAIAPAISHEFQRPDVQSGGAQAMFRITVEEVSLNLISSVFEPTAAAACAVVTAEEIRRTDPSDLALRVVAPTITSLQNHLRENK